MKVHANAALGPAGRIALCELIESGVTLRAAAAALSVAPATAHRWWHRRQAASAAELASDLWLHDRSSRPHRQPHRLTPAQEQPILRARRETGLGPGRLAGICRRARSTIWKVLHRHGLSRRLSPPREATRRYEWARPGALLHVDTTRLPRFESPGHRVRGRSSASRSRRHKLGYAFLRLRRRSLPLCLRRAASRRACRDRRRVPGPSDRALRGARPRSSGGGDERQRKPLSLPPVRRRAQTGRRSPDLHPALHPALERQGRALLSDPQVRVGLRPRLAQLSSQDPAAAILPSLLQPATPTQLAGGPTADQPRSQRLWAGQLGRPGGLGAARPFMSPERPGGGHCAVPGPGLAQALRPYSAANPIEPGAPAPSSTAWIRVRSPSDSIRNTVTEASSEFFAYR